MRSYVVVLGLSALVAGISLLGIVQQQVLRPRPLAGAVLVLDERPADFNKQFSLGVASAFESDMTLITVTDPMISVGSASIEPVADGLSIEGVMQLLEQARPEAIIREIRIKREQGMTIYEIDFSDNWRLKMNAANGQMLSLEPSSSKSPPTSPPLAGLYGTDHAARRGRGRTSAPSTLHAQRRKAGNSRWRAGLQGEVRRWDRRICRRHHRGAFVQQAAAGTL